MAERGACLTFGSNYSFRVLLKGMWTEEDSDRIAIPAICGLVSHNSTIRGKSRMGTYAYFEKSAHMHDRERGEDVRYT